jgi:hypothetical protein
MMLKYRIEWNGLPWGNGWRNMEEVRAEMKRLSKAHQCNKNEFKVWSITTIEEEIMICYTKETKIGGDPVPQEKLKSLTDLTRRLFLAVYKERGWRLPFTELEVEFMKLTGQSPTLDTPLDSPAKSD